MVSKIFSQNGTGGYDTLSYSYEDAKFHLQGKGFMGYTVFNEANTSSGFLTKSYFGYNSNYFNTFLDSSETRRLSDNGLISKIKNVNNYKLLSSSQKRIFPYVDFTTSTDNLTNTSKTEDYIYDNDGNPTTVTTTYGSNDIITTVSNIYNLYGGWGPK
ncbi:MAG: hypothetical protein HC905_25855 [Bacteroidales bacterium]|nr:hypothetical protein [Bacteroidales bacterium]